MSSTSSTSRPRTHGVLIYADRNLPDMPVLRAPSAAGSLCVTVMTPTPAPNAAWTPSMCRGAWECPCLGPIVAELQRCLFKPLVGILECTSGWEPGAHPPAPQEAAASACCTGSLTRHMLLFTAAAEARLTLLRGLFWVLGSRPS